MGHSEELEVSNRTYYRNEVVWGENSPPLIFSRWWWGGENTWI